MSGLKRKTSSAGAAAKRPSDSVPSSSKKPRSDGPSPAGVPTALVDSAQVDFPRGGGSGLTPFEHASTLREARSELAKASRGDDDLFKEGRAATASSSKSKLGDGPDGDQQKRALAKQKFNREKNNAKRKKTAFGRAAEEDAEAKSKGKAASKDHFRIEHLNYKRLAPGTRLLCSVAAVHPLALVLSLPNQLVGHVPITSISSTFTAKLHEAAENDSDEEESNATDSDGEEADETTGNAAEARLNTGLPELRDCFQVGQWVSAAVVQVHGPGVTKGVVPGQQAHEFDRESRRVELTLDPEAVNDGVNARDLAKGFVLPVSIRSKEDNGFLLDAGIDGVEGFAPFNQVDASSFYPGQVVQATVSSVAAKGRNFTASLQPSAVKTASLGPDSAPSASALVPGCLVTGLITASLPVGLNVKLWGMFDATIDTFHLPAPLPEGKEMHEVYKTGSKIRGRILWESRKDEMGVLSSAANGEEDGDAAGLRAIALSSAPHVTSLSLPDLDPSMPSLQTAFQIGSKVQAKVVRTDSEWGLTCSIKGHKVQGFTHISRVSDDHIEKLPSRVGPFAIGTTHEARVIGHAPTDRLLLLSFQDSVLRKSFMRVDEVEVGSTVRATVTRFGANGSAIFLNLGGAFEGVVFPLHFADVPLKRPEKKYKPGATVNARILSVDSVRNRIVCTLKKSLLSSELAIVASIQDARVGVVTQATVSKFVDGGRGLVVDLFGGLRAFVPTSEATEAPLGPSAPSLQSHFFEGKVVKVRLTHVDYESSRVIASVKQASPSFLARLDVASVQAGDKVSATVAAVHQDVVVCEVQPSKVRGLLSLTVLASKRSQGVEEVREALQDGETLDDLVVIDKHAERGIVILGDAQQPRRPRTSGISEPLDVGTRQTGRVQSNPADPNAVTVLLNGGCRGRLHLSDVADDFGDAALPANGEQIEVSILRLKNSGRRADVSTRLSRIDKNASSEVKDGEVDAAADVKAGQKVRGFVKATSAAGLFVDLGRNVTARVLIGELFDEYVKEWQGRFKAGQLVSGTITAVDAANSKIELSLRSEPGASKKSKADRAKEKADAQEADKQKKQVGQLRIKDLSKGMKVNGFVRAVQEYGVFVQIEGTQISGLAHKSQLTDTAPANVTDPTRAFSVGDRVKAMILDVHKEKKRVDFGLKPSYFTAEDFEGDDEDEGDSGDEEDTDMDQQEEEGEDDESSNEGDDDEDEDEDDIEVDAEALLRAGSDDDEDMLQLGGSDDDEEDEDEEDEDEDGDEDENEDENEDEDEDEESDETDEASSGAAVLTNGKTAPAMPALELGGGFSWSAPTDATAAAAATHDDDDDDSSDSSDDDDAPGDKAQKRVQRGKRGARRQLEDDMTADLATKTPESSADFERLLLSTPNSSYLWIQFMSFHMQLSEVEQAREVARRALRAINYREEEEKLNVWIALLNLENSYGTEETLESSFREAVQFNDARTVHLKLASILEKTGKFDQAADLWRRTAKKFGASSEEIWIAYSQFFLRNGRANEARALLPRALQSLDKSRHVKAISAFAISEFKISPGGDAERGRTIFEGLVDSYPKRLDLWWQYIDQEASIGNVPGARSLFDRVLNLRQSTKKGKSVLKKWLDFEKSKGDAKGEQVVLQRARKFVEEMGQKQQQGGESADAAEIDGDEGMESEEGSDEDE
ncbi:unnamed protein product [Jaminaea pallidilutea]